MNNNTIPYELIDISILSMAESGFAPLPFLLLRDDAGGSLHINALALPYFFDKPTLIAKLYELCQRDLLAICKMQFSSIGEGTRFIPIDIPSPQAIEQVYDNEFYHIVPTEKGGSILTDYYQYQWHRYIGIKGYTLTDIDKLEELDDEVFNVMPVEQRIIVASQCLETITTLKNAVKSLDNTTLVKEATLQYWKPNEWTQLYGDIHTLFYHVNVPYGKFSEWHFAFVRHCNNQDFMDRKQRQKLHQFILDSRDISLAKK